MKMLEVTHDLLCAVSIQIYILNEFLNRKLSENIKVLPNILQERVAKTLHGDNLLGLS